MRWSSTELAHIGRLRYRLAFLRRRLAEGSQNPAAPGYWQAEADALEWAINRLESVKVES